ncbi:MAG: hypothetical protein HYY22_07860 [Thaumarchaeota archaeon]|nr:hypothetical protein [Nitrososphaerota archaeon]
MIDRNDRLGRYWTILKIVAEAGKNGFLKNELDTIVVKERSVVSSKTLTGVLETLNKDGLITYPPKIQNGEQSKVKWRNGQPRRATITDAGIQGIKDHDLDVSLNRTRPLVLKEITLPEDAIKRVKGEELGKESEEITLPEDAIKRVKGEELGKESEEITLPEDAIKRVKGEEHEKIRQMFPKHRTMREQLHLSLSGEERAKKEFFEQASDEEYVNDWASSYRLIVGSSPDDPIVFSDRLQEEFIESALNTVGLAQRAQLRNKKADVKIWELPCRVIIDYTPKPKRNLDEIKKKRRTQFMKQFHPDASKHEVVVVSAGLDVLSRYEKWKIKTEMEKVKSYYKPNDEYARDLQKLQLEKIEEVRKRVQQLRMYYYEFERAFIHYFFS